MIDLVLLFLCTLLIAVFIPNRAHAASSLSRVEFVNEISQQKVRSFIEAHFDLENEARASRVGRFESTEDGQTGNLVAPFEILARSRQGGEKVVLQVEGDLRVVPCSMSAHFSPECD